MTDRIRLEAAIRRTADNITRTPLSEAIEDPYLDPKNPPMRTAIENGISALQSSNIPSATADPNKPLAEFTQMKSADVAATSFGEPTCNMMRSGDSKTPPPIPTKPLMRPIRPPIATHLQNPHRTFSEKPAPWGSSNLNPARTKMMDNSES